MCGFGGCFWLRELQLDPLEFLTVLPKPRLGRKLGNLSARRRGALPRAGMGREVFCNAAGSSALLHLRELVEEAGQSVRVDSRIVELLHPETIRLAFHLAAVAAECAGCENLCGELGQHVRILS